jgi:hypothetical protein
MGLNNKWGGSDEIKLLSNRLNIVIQEIRRNQDIGDSQSFYVASDQISPDTQANQGIIYIIADNAKAEELTPTSDKELFVAQAASASSAIHSQHFRLIKSNPLGLEIEIDMSSSAEKICKLSKRKEFSAVNLEEQTEEEQEQVEQPITDERTIKKAKLNS